MSVLLLGSTPLHRCHLMKDTGLVPASVSQIKPLQHLGPVLCVNISSHFLKVYGRDGMLGHMARVSSLRRNWKTSGCTFCTPSAVCKLKFESPHILASWQQYWVFTVAALLGVQWLFTVLLCIALMASDARHFFMCLVTIVTSSLVSIYSRPMLCFKLNCLSLPSF
jgi:hypothetical protein